ncbi:MAG: exodeoxyribonuclease V subunit gamma [Candidatus Binatia bacterium]|nr:exodeoxyribonuclease V subunit gamma [Candidatus Binatia bacterium]
MTQGQEGMARVPHLVLHRSNRLECLVDALCESLQATDLHPLRPRTIVIPGAGMDHWLSLELARRFGIWGHSRFLYPRDFFEQLFVATGVGTGGVVDPYSVECLTWAIARCLPAVVEQKEFAEVRHYLENFGEGQLDWSDLATATGRFALASRLAEVFADYIVYRPQWLHEWQRAFGRGQAPRDWQGHLWRVLVQEFGDTHFAARAYRWTEQLKTGAVATLPERAFWFGFTRLAPLYLELLGALAGCCEVHLFVPSPSPEYWAEIRSRREILREAWARSGGLPDVEAELGAAEGHPLLASLGQAGREFQAAVESILTYREDDRYKPPKGDSLLHILQRDIFELVQRGHLPGSVPAVEVPCEDRSIQVHACHSPMREIEVLADVLRDFLERDPTLAPEDILVLCSDIELYAPLIAAVFERELDPQRRIPYCIGDRPQRALDQVVDAFIAAVEGLTGRVALSDGVALLHAAPVRAQLGLSEAEWELARSWLRDAGARWGIDERHREEVGLPPFREYTWSFALDRILLGLALPPEDTALFRNVAPYGEIEGEAAIVAGKIASFCSRWFSYRPPEGARKTPLEWIESLDRLRADLLSQADPFVDGHARLERVLKQVRQAVEQANFTEPVPFAVVWAQVQALLQQEGSAFGVFRGGVNFAAMRPTRCVPARVVCLVGMSDGVFPRPGAADTLSRAHQRRCTGDPDRRSSDRYLFLEALLSARDALVITYQGRDIRNNTERPPSVVVTELLDCLDQTFAPAGGLPTRKHLVVQHPLQPFSPRYFEGEPQLFSFAADQCEGARALTERRDSPAPLVRALLPEPEPMMVSLEQLIAMLERPHVSFLTQRLGIVPQSDLEVASDDVPLELSGLGAWQAGDLAVRLLMQGVPLEQAETLCRARGLLPPGRLGELAWRSIAPAVAQLVGQARGLTQRKKPFPAPVEFVLDFAPDRLIGFLRNLWPHAQVVVTYSKLSPRLYLATWIRHLALNAWADSRLPRTTFLVAREEKSPHDPRVVTFPPETQARTYLEGLMRLYRWGMRFPLPFEPRAGAAYVKALQKKQAQEALLAAANELRLNPYGGPAIPESYRLAWLLLYRTPAPGISDWEQGMANASLNFAELAVRLQRFLQPPAENKVV